MPQPLEGVLGHLGQHGGSALAHAGHDHQGAQPLQQVVGVAPGVVAGLHGVVHRGEGGGAVDRGQRVHEVVQQRLRDVAEQGGRQLGVDVAVGPGDQLVEHRHRVPHGAAAGADHQRQGRGLHRHVLAAADVLQVLHQPGGRHEPEGEVVRARADGDEHLFRLGRGEDEDHVLRRLLDHLEQGVEPFGGDLVRLVDDDHLVPVTDGDEGDPVAQVPGVVDAAVAGRVDLDDVERARAAVGQVQARRAHQAGRRGGALDAVERTGQDPGARGLAAPAGPGEQVRVVDATLGQGGRDRPDRVVLTHDVGEGVGAVPAVQREERSAAISHGPHLTATPGHLSSAGRNPGTGAGSSPGRPRRGPRTRSTT